jgi:hypothetical protein
MNQIVYNTETLANAFASIEKSDLKIETIICSTCDCVFKIEDKTSKACEHLIEMFSEWNEFYKGL